MEMVEVPFVTDVTEEAILLVNVQRLMVIVIVEAVVENVDTVQVAASATSATDLVILLANVERRKIVVTSVMEPDTCYNCNMVGHIVKDCPNAGTKTCYKCGGIGHILRIVPQNNYLNNFSQKLHWMIMKTHYIC